MSVHRQTRARLINYEIDFVTRAFILENCPGLTRSQLNHWLIHDWVSTYQNGPRGPRYIYREEYFVIKYMVYLVNKLHILPSSAAKIARAAKECMAVKDDRTWVNVEGTTLGIPLIEEHR